MNTAGRFSNCTVEKITSVDTSFPLPVSTVTTVVGVGIAAAGYPVVSILSDRLGLFRELDGWLQSDLTK